MKVGGLFPEYQDAVRATDTHHGWLCAKSFSVPEIELHAALEEVAYVDSSCWGRLAISGSDALDLLHRISSNALKDLALGETRGSLMLTDKGRLVSFAYVMNGGPSLVLLTPPGLEPQTEAYLEKYILLEDVTIKSITDETVMVSALGPRAESLARYVSRELQGKETTARQPGLHSGLTVLRSAMRGITEYHLIADQRDSKDFWSLVVRSGDQVGARQVGADAYEHYRIVHALPAAGTELTEAYNPYDISLLEFVSYTKGCYIGQEVVARLVTYKKARRSLFTLRIEHPFDRQEDSAEVMDGATVLGTITSVSRLPAEGGYPALGVLRGEQDLEGKEVEIRVGKDQVMRGRVVGGMQERAVS